MTLESDASLFDSLVYLADSLVSGFDVVDLADHLVTTCLQIEGVSAAGIMLHDQHSALRVLASSSEETRLLELLELQNAEGPCLEAFQSGKPFTADDLATLESRWPDFAAEAGRQNVRSSVALPMRLRSQVIGVLNLFCDRPGGLAHEDQQIAQVLTSMATIGILTHRTMRQQALLAEQLQTALNSRIVIEQAKGVVAESAKLSMDAAFDLLRTASRRSRRPLSEVAEKVALGQLSVTDLRTASVTLTDSTRGPGGPSR